MSLTSWIDIVMIIEAVLCTGYVLRFVNILPHVVYNVMSVINQCCFNVFYLSIKTLA